MELRSFRRKWPNFFGLFNDPNHTMPCKILSQISDVLTSFSFLFFAQFPYFYFCSPSSLSASFPTQFSFPPLSILYLNKMGQLLHEEWQMILQVLFLISLTITLLISGLTSNSWAPQWGPLIKNLNILKSMSRSYMGLAKFSL